MTTLDPKLGTRSDAAQSLRALLSRSRTATSGGQPETPESFDMLLRQQLDRRPHSDRSAATKSSRPEPFLHRDRAERPSIGADRTPLSDRWASEPVRTPGDTPSSRPAPKPRANDTETNPATVAVRRNTEAIREPGSGSSAVADRRSAIDTDEKAGQTSAAVDEGTKETSETDGAVVLDGDVAMAVALVVDPNVVANPSPAPSDTEPTAGIDTSLAVVVSDDRVATELASAETPFLGAMSTASAAAASLDESATMATDPAAESADLEAARAQVAVAATDDGTPADSDGLIRLTEESATADASEVDTQSEDGTVDVSIDAAAESADNTRASADDQTSETMPETNDADSVATATETTVDADATTDSGTEAPIAPRVGTAENDQQIDSSVGVETAPDPSAEPVAARPAEPVAAVPTAASNPAPLGDAGDPSVRIDGVSAAQATSRTDAASATSPATARTMSFDGEVAEQVRQAVNLVRQSGPGRHEVSLLLRPDDLGVVTVELVQNGDEVTVRIVTQTTAAQERLDRGRLLADLQSAGLDPAAVDIDHRDPADADSGSDGNRRGDGRFGTSQSGIESNDEGAMVQRRSAGGTQAGGGVDLAL